MSTRSQRWLIHRNQEEGYVLLTLLLVFALLAIAAAVVVPSLQFEIRRDREEELIHRGVQYRRAIRLYQKGFGRYPNRPEDLVGTSGQRFLRKLYKDPITGKDFRLLHMGDVQTPTSTLGTPVAQTSSDANASTPNNPQDPAASSDQNSNQVNQNNTQSNISNTSGGVAGNTSTTTSSSSNGTYGLGPLIFGVASTSKDRTIREFNHKNHYNDWWFYYDPRYEQARETNSPTDPMQGVVQGQGQVPPAGSPPATPESGQNPQQTPAQSPQ